MRHSRWKCLKSTSLGYVGKTFSIFIPVEVNGAVKNHFFSFKIKDVQVAPRVGRK